MAGIDDDILAVLNGKPKGRAPALVVQGKIVPTDDEIMAIVNGKPPTDNGGAPSDVTNVPTSKSDPLYHGAVPVNQDLIQARGAADKTIDPGAAIAFSSRALNAIPVAGPTVLGGVQSAASGPGNSLSQVQERTAQAQSQNPGAAMAGDVAGGVMGYGGLARMLPAAVTEGFGAGMAARSATAMPGNALIMGTDAAARGDNPVAGAAMGATGGALAPVANRLGYAAGKGLKAIYEPFTQGGQTAIAERYLGRMAQGGPLSGNSNIFVPGSEPTLAQVTGNPGLAAAERLASTNPLTMQPFVAREQQNAAARVKAMDALRGDSNSLDALIAQRSAQADPIRELAFQNRFTVDSSPIVDKIDEILKSPSGQRDVVVSALNNIKKKLIIKPEVKNADGSIRTPAQYQDDPEQIYGIRKAIGDMLSPLSKGTEANKQLASSELQDVRSVMDPVIEDGAPGFKDYLKTFRDLSKPVNEQQFLQNANIYDTKGNVNLGPIDRLIKSVQKLQVAPGTNNAKSIAPQTMDQLQAIRSDLLRQQGSLLGKAKGSDTFQNLATANVGATMGLPSFGLEGLINGHPASAAVGYLVRKAYAAKNDAIMDKVVEKLLSPQAPTSKAFLGTGGGTTASPASLARGNALTVPLITQGFAQGVPPVVQQTNRLTAQ